MRGIRKRISIGFLSIVGLLFVSGAISSLELGRLSNDAEEILNASRHNVELAKEMLDAIHQQNIAVIHLAVLRDGDYDSLCRAGMQRLEQAVSTARREAPDKSQLDSLAASTARLRMTADAFLAFGAPDGKAWYDNRYEAQYEEVVSAIEDYMTSAQTTIAPRAEQLRKNAYRAVTPVLISLVVMIATMLMLFYFTNMYCISPIVAMNKSLAQYLSFRIPFRVKVECKDELQELKEKIEALIAMQKQNKA
ncbi:MAG: hypothetical protein K2H81_00940 [Alistipes sp.]|nr:hypothetical protein [Alistipes sp.]